MTEDGLQLSDFPSTPAARQAAWFLHHSMTQGCDLTVEEVAEHMRFEGSWTPADSLERFRSAKPDESRKLVETNSVSPYEFEFAEVDGAGRRWRATFRVDEGPPHRIHYFEFRADLGPGVVLREATPADTAALAAVERAAPIVLGEVSQTYDRGEDFLAFTRLMEENVCFLVEKDGEILGVYCCASHLVRFAGSEQRAMLFHHLRIPTSQEKRGFFSALNMQMFDYYAERYGMWWDTSWAPYAYIALANVAAMRLGGPGSWSFGPFRALLDCEALAGEHYGTAAQAEDAPAIVHIVNRCHDEEEMFLPYSVESLTARLERAPDLYSWGDVLLSERAVLGVWASGLRVTTVRGDQRRESVRASVLDYGFLPGAEDEFERLIRSSCRGLLERGSTEVSILTSEGSPGFDVLKRLAFEMEPFDFKMQIPEPEGAAQKGLYVDAVYF